MYQAFKLAIFHTWASGCSDPREAAPCLTPSARRVMVMTAFCAALASCSWFDAAPATSVFVSSTKDFAVLSMVSLHMNITLVTTRPAPVYNSQFTTDSAARLFSLHSYCHSLSLSHSFTFSGMCMCLGTVLRMSLALCYVKLI